MTQMLLAHCISLTFGSAVQSVLQLPHRVVVVVRSVSQPLATLPSQLPKPASQLSMTQVPLAQDAVALAGAQGVLQAPQSVKVLSGVSQPLDRSSSQLPNPEVHVVMQLPVAQLAVALAGAVQGVPQAPQLVAVLSAAQLPLQQAWLLVVQSAQLVPQVVLLVLGTHAPPLRQVPVPQTHVVPEHTPPVGQATHVPPQHFPPVQVVPSVAPAQGLLVTQLPLVQAWPAEQVLPQAPQLLTSVLRFFSQPFSGLLSQLQKPVLHTQRPPPPVPLHVEFSGQTNPVSQRPRDCKGLGGPQVVAARARGTLSAPLIPAAKPAPRTLSAARRERADARARVTLSNR
jgi:hypothetical protein